MSDGRREMKLKRKRQREHDRERRTEKKTSKLTRMWKGFVDFMKDEVLTVPRDRVIRYDNENARRRRQIQKGLLTRSSRGVTKIKSGRT